MLARGCQWTKSKCKKSGRRNQAFYPRCNVFLIQAVAYYQTTWCIVMPTVVDVRDLVVGNTVYSICRFAGEKNMVGAGEKESRKILNESTVDSNDSKLTRLNRLV